jgi:putative ABC transport system permease protein
MTDLLLALRYLRARPLVTVLTILSVALGLALATAVIVLTRQAEATLRQETAYWDIAVGAKGSPLQLVLNALYYLDAPTGNIPRKVWDDLAHDPMVTQVVPLNMGDNYLGTPIVGTTPAFFAGRGAGGATVPLSAGRMFQQPMEAVLGADIARRRHLTVGASIVGAHGWAPGGDVHAATPYTVVGILTPTGGSMDRGIYADYHSVWLVHAHAKAEEAGHAEPEGGAPEVHLSSGEITVLLVRLAQPGRRYQMADALTKGYPVMATVPVDQVDRIVRTFIAPMQGALVAVAYLVVLVAALSILISLYLTIHQRRRDIAVQRALGATPGDIFRLITLEAALLAGAGVAVGWLAGHGLVAAAGSLAAEKFGIVPHAWAVSPLELAIALTVWVLGIVAGLLPAIVAYRLPVADTLTKE